MPIRAWSDPDHNISSENDIWDAAERAEKHSGSDSQKTHKWKAGHAYDYLLHKQSRYSVTLTDL